MSDENKINDKVKAILTQVGSRVAVDSIKEKKLDFGSVMEQVVISGSYVYVLKPVQNKGFTIKEIFKIPDGSNYDELLKSLDNFIGLTVTEMGTYYLFGVGSPSVSVNIKNQAIAAAGGLIIDTVMQNMGE